MKLRIKPVKRSPNVLNLSVAVIVFTLAQSRAAKIEAQHRKTKSVERFHRMEHNFVVQRPAKQRMWMANHRRMRRVLRTRVEQSLQPARRPLEKQRTNG